MTDEFESIVLGLAESDPIAEIDDRPTCAHCRSEEGESHAPACLWLRARRALRMSDTTE